MAQKAAQNSDIEKIIEGFMTMLKASDLSQTGEDIVAAVKLLVETYVALKADTEMERAARTAEFAAALRDLRTATNDAAAATTSDLEQHAEIDRRKQQSDFVAALDTFRTTIETKITLVKDGETPSDQRLAALIKPLIPPPIPGSSDSSEDIRNKLELLTGEERLKMEAIRGLTEIIDELKKLRGGTIISGHGALYNLSDVDIAGILAGQSIKWDGTRFIAYTPAGGTTTAVYEEAPTDSGDHTTFTLAHTPAASTLRLYRGGARQQAAVDYTLVGATITLVNSLQTGEILLADYEY